MQTDERFDLWRELEGVSAYIKSCRLGELVQSAISKWSWFDKKTIGSQYISCVDSISANIAEGYGRYFFKDKIKFYYYSRGSALEAYCWTTKAEKRGLFPLTEYSLILGLVKDIPHDIHVLIQNNRNQLRSISKFNI